MVQLATVGERKDLERWPSMGSPAQYMVLAFSGGYASLVAPVRSSNSPGSNSVPKYHVRSLAEEVHADKLLAPATEFPVG